MARHLEDRQVVVATGAPRSQARLSHLRNLRRLHRPNTGLGDRGTLFSLTALLVALVLVWAALVTGSALKRNKRALFEYSDGVEQVLGSNRPLRSSFSCDGLGYGYYADPEIDCKVFHVCQSFKMSDGSIQNNHWSFFCPNQTTFNQVSLSCAHPEDSIPCESAKEFYYVNDYFGEPSAQSVKDADLVAAQELVARAYGSRLSGQSVSSSEPRR